MPTKLKPRTPADEQYKPVDDREEQRKAFPLLSAELEEQEQEEVKPVKKPKKAEANDDNDYFDLDDEGEGKPLKKSKGGELESAGKGSTISKKIITLDNRKLTKKDEAKLLVWKGRNRGRAVDTFFRRQAEEARKKFGHKSVYVGSEAESLIITIPMFGGHGPNAHKFPGCLPMEFVMAQDGFPLGLVIQLVAKHGAGKSGLLAEFGRWFFMAGGGMSLQESETKFNPSWYKSIMGSEFYDSMPLYRCSSVEDWQRKLTYAIGATKTAMEGTKEQPGPGRRFPVLFGVDSIMGKQSEETQEAILGKKGKDGRRGTTGKGYASRGYPVEAQMITRYMRTIPVEMDDWPFSLVLVNHLRVKTDDMGNQERLKAGGEQVNFQESFELELKKVGGHKKKIQCRDFEGFPVEISCEKNSFGPTHRRIQTRVLWWEEENDEGEWNQVTVWDWDWSTIHLLDSLLHGENASPRLKAALKEIDFHLECPTRSDIENTAWSKTLGMAKSDAMSWSQVGAMIRENPKLMNRLRKALRINRRPLLQGDYLEMMDSLVEELP